MGGTVYDLEEAELCYAPQYGSAKDVVNLAGEQLLSNGGESGRRVGEQQLRYGSAKDVVNMWVGSWWAVE